MVRAMRAGRAMVITGVKETVPEQRKEVAPHG